MKNGVGVEEIVQCIFEALQQTNPVIRALHLKHSQRAVVSPYASYLSIYRLICDWYMLWYQ